MVNTDLKVVKFGEMIVAPGIMRFHGFEIDAEGKDVDLKEVVKTILKYCLEHLNEFNRGWDQNEVL